MKRIPTIKAMSKDEGNLTSASKAKWRQGFTHTKAVRVANNNAGL